LPTEPPAVRLRHEIVERVHDNAFHVALPESGGSLSARVALESGNDIAWRDAH
jgi:hypothetical protein